MTISHIDYNRLKKLVANIKSSDYLDIKKFYLVSYLDNADLMKPFEPFLGFDTISETLVTICPYSFDGIPCLEKFEFNSSIPVDEVFKDYLEHSSECHIYSKNKNHKVNLINYYFIPLIEKNYLKTNEFFSKNCSSIYSNKVILSKDLTASSIINHYITKLINIRSSATVDQRLYDIFIKTYGNDEKEANKSVKIKIKHEESEIESQEEGKWLNKELKLILNYHKQPRGQRIYEEFDEEIINPNDMFDQENLSDNSNISLTEPEEIEFEILNIPIKPLSFKQIDRQFI